MTDQSARRDALVRMNYVARMWQAFADGGVDELAKLVPADAKWQPPGQDTPLRGIDELRTFMEEHSGREMPMPIAYEVHGEDVLVHAEQVIGNGAAGHLWLLYRFEGQRLVEALSFEDEDQARAQLQPG